MRPLSVVGTMLLMSCALVPASTPVATASISGHGAGTSAYGAAAAAVRAGLQAQMAAWNRGDLEAALGRYWDDPQMTWVSRFGVACRRRRYGR
jgi:hypothetical protein